MQPDPRGGFAAPENAGDFRHAQLVPISQLEDVALVLTCLSYYYQGLTSSQLASCFNLLFKQGDAAVEYEVRSNYIKRQHNY